MCSGRELINATTVAGVAKMEMEHAAATDRGVGIAMVVGFF